jgi:hypothetical protein
MAAVTGFAVTYFWARAGRGWGRRHLGISLPLPCMDLGWPALTFASQFLESKEVICT